MRTIVIFSILTSILVPLFVSNAFAVDGSGNIVTEKRAVSGFDQVSMQISGVLYIIQGETESLEIEADDNILPRIKTIVSGKTLTVDKKWFTSLNPSQPIVYRLYVKSLASIAVSGSVDVHSESLTFDQLIIKVSGSSDMKFGLLSGNSLTGKISGSGDIAIKKGAATDLTIKVSGSGKWDSMGLQTENVVVEITGSGDASVRAKEKLDIRISGSGDLVYSGNPRVTTSVSGSGYVRSADES